MANFAFLEAFLVHARCLAAFFYDTRTSSTKADDILAEDFFDNPRDWADSKDPIIQTEYPLIHKYLAHLSAHRLKEQHEWPYREICVALIGAMTRFVDKAPPTRLHPILRERCYAYREAL